MSEMALSKIDGIMQWFATVGITVHPSKIEIRQMPDEADAIGVFATSDIQESQTIACIPKDAVLSIVNTAAADILAASELGGGLALIFAVLYEQHVRGKDSKWHGYLQSLPARACLPVFWMPEQIAELQGTEAEGRAASDLPLLREDFASIEALLDKHPELPRAGFTMESYMAAASWVASRGFGVDDLHGYSLVPLADIFNHKASIVRLTDEYAIEGGDDGGSSDGSDGEGGSGSGSDAEGGSDAEEEAEEEASGSAAADPASAADEQASAVSSVEEDEEAEEAASSDGGGDAEQRWRPQIRRADGGEDPRWRLEIAICSSERDGQEVLEIVAASHIAAGAEVHNTYGELSNAELVSKYGFALPGGSPFDAVSLPAEGLAAAGRAALGKAAAGKRVSFLEQHSELLSDPGEHLCLAPGGALEMGLVAALFVLFAGKAEFASCHSMEAVAELLSRRLRVSAAAAQQSGGAAAGGAPAEAAADARNGVSAAARNAAPSELEEAAEDALPASVPAAAAVAALPPSAVAALSDSIRLRLGRYRRDSIEEDLAVLAVARAEPPSEVAKARVAALTLVVREKSILSDALAALGYVAEQGGGNADSNNPKRARRGSVLLAADVQQL